MEPIAMTLGQKFEVEKFSREIDSFDDVQQLRDLAKDLLVAWKQQQASTAWVIRQKEGLSSWWLEGSVAGGLLVTGTRLAVMTAESRCEIFFSSKHFAWT